MASFDGVVFGSFVAQIFIRGIRFCDFGVSGARFSAGQSQILVSEVPVG